MLAIIDTPFVALAKAIGAGKDELKLIFTFLISYPLAGVLKRLPDSPVQKNLFIVAVSLFYIVGVFDLWGGIRTLLISSAGAYLIASRISGPYMPWIGFVFLMGHMLYSHMYRQLRPVDGEIDITGAQMVLVMKLTAFCWNVHDGRLPESELNELQKDRALKQVPSILDYSGYVLYFPSFFAGPSFDFSEYRKYIDGSMFNVNVTDKKGVTKVKRRIPSSSKPATWKAIQGLLWIGAFMQLSAMYNESYALGPEFLKLNFFRRTWWLFMFAFTARTKYYGVWMLTEGACILSGLGFNGLDENKKPKWDRVTNVDPIALETAQNTRAFLESWNMNTNKWLKNYVYLRVTPKGKKPGFRSSMATFATSALWHGTAPGYYMAFITASFAQTIAKHFRRHVRPFFLNAESGAPGPYMKAYNVFCWFATLFGFAYIVVPFLVLDFTPSVTIWSRCYWYGHVIIAIVMAFFSSPAKGMLIRKLKKRTSKAQAAKQALEDSLQREPALGISDDPTHDIEEIEAEIRAEVSRRRGSSVSGPRVRLNKA